MTEIPLNHEQEPIASPFDAVLVHCYWLSENGTTQLGLRSRLADRAAALFYDHGKGAKKIVLAGGHLWGKEYASAAELMAKELEEKYHVPKSAIIIPEQEAYSTGGEVEIFTQLANEKEWTNLLDIAAQKHLWTIPGIYKKIGADVKFKSDEEILREKDSNPHVKRLLKRLGRSRYEFSLMLHEVGIWTAMHLLNLDYATLENRNKSKRTAKSKDSLLPGDVYKT